MTGINSSTPCEPKSPIDSQVSATGYGLPGEHFHELNPKDQDRLRLRGVLLEDANSSQSAKADKDYFTQLRNRVHNL